MRNAVFFLVVMVSAVVEPLLAGNSAELSSPRLDIAAGGSFPLVACRYLAGQADSSTRPERFGWQQLRLFLPHPDAGKKKRRGDKKQRLRPQELHPLYPIFTVRRLGKNLRLEVLFLLPRAAVERLQHNAGHIKAEYQPSLRRHFWRKIFSSPRVLSNIITDQVASDELMRKWREGFHAQLTSRLMRYEDTTPETLLYMRFFDTVPQLRPQNWKSSPLARLFFTLSGFNDVRDAIPLDRHRQPLLEPATLQAPKPLQLLAVKVAQAAPLPDSPAHWVPRSCYYVEWPSLSACENTLARLAKFLDRWSTGTFPRSIARTIRDYRQQLGLTKEYFARNLQSASLRIALAGWDPYFQSGTSLLVVIKSSKPVTVLPQAPYVSRPQENVLVVANSAKLFRMAMRAEQKGRSLGQMNNFLYSRRRLKARQGEDEQLFFYLSDYWLVNFLSPRWQIISDRLAGLDSRLKLLQLLKLCRRYEVYPPATGAVTLEMLKQDPYLRPEVKKWLFTGLIEKNGVIMDRQLGSIYHHPPIDRIPFKLVTKTEFERYNRFKRLYRRRWQQIDPIAFQVVKNSNELYKTRLYVSPLSNRSQFRSLRNFVAKKKPLHSFSRVTGQAVKLSIAVPTPPLRAFGIRAPLPLLIFLQLTLFDFAPGSYSPTTWLDPDRPYDSSSYMRLPLAVSIPSAVIDSLGMVRSQIDFSPSPYRNITMTREMFDQTYALMRFDSKDGLSYFSFDPATLERIRDNHDAKQVTDTVPCDIRLAVDLINGYQLRHKIWFEALKNRAIASWRRYNRRLRIGGFFSVQPDKLPAEFDKEHIFANQAMVVSDHLVRRIPPLRSLAGSQPYRYPSSVLREAGNLPELLRLLTALDIFITVEPNALLFESHYRFQSQERATPGRAASGNGAAREEETTPQLDFDEQ